MYRKQIASDLSGNSLGDRIDPALLVTAKNNGIVIVYGESDDGMRFAGAVNAVVDSYEGATVFFDQDGLMPMGDDVKFTGGEAVTAVWDDDNDPVWAYETKIPHSTFVIYEDGVPFCKGIVFNLSDTDQDPSDSMCWFIEYSDATESVGGCGGGVCTGLGNLYAIDAGDLIPFMSGLPSWTKKIGKQLAEIIIRFMYKESTACYVDGCDNLAVFIVDGVVDSHYHPTLPSCGNHKGSDHKLIYFVPDYARSLLEVTPIQSDIVLTITKSSDEIRDLVVRLSHLRSDEDVAQFASLISDEEKAKYAVLDCGHASSHAGDDSTINLHNGRIVVICHLCWGFIANKMMIEVMARVVIGDNSDDLSIGVVDSFHFNSSHTYAYCAHIEPKWSCTGLEDGIRMRIRIGNEALLLCDLCHSSLSNEIIKEMMGRGSGKGV